ncbi:MAG: radical SAM protein, partial [Duncaniella sp.]|nr:radical SAM protein [Duncaniella sp.]
MLLRGEYDGKEIDNTTPEEINALIEAYRRIGPREVMIYSIDRQTPARNLVKVPREELDAIAKHITDETGIPVQTA